MAAYTKALTEAAGGDSIAKLNEAAKGFNGAAGELAGSAKAPATIGPAVGALTNLGVRLSEARRTQKNQGRDGECHVKSFLLSLFASKRILRVSTIRLLS